MVVLLLLSGIQDITEEVCSAVMLHIPTGVFRLVRKIAKKKTIGFTFVCPSVWNNWAPTKRIFYEILYFDVLEKSVEKIQVSLNFDKNNGYFT
jgi:hypothetical protein